MKRLFTFFTLLLFVMSSCTKVVDVSQGEMSGESVSFTASVVDMSGTKATLKNSWSEGDGVALFKGTVLYSYTIADDGTMTGTNIIVDINGDITCTAFYPYTEGLETIEEYEALCATGCDTDYLKAQTTITDKYVELLFMHQMAALTFTVTVTTEGAVADAEPVITLAMDGNFFSNNAVALDFDTFEDSKFEVNYFVEDGTDISSAMIKLEYGDATTFHTLKLEESNTLEAGKQYPFSYTI